MTMKTLSLLMLCLISTHLFANSKSKMHEDFHISLYENAMGSISEFELFTKQANKSAFMGLACTDMTPFPTFQIILQGDDIISTLSKGYLEIDYTILIKGKEVTNPVPLTASLKAIYKDDQFSNKIRMEVSTGKLKSMTEIQDHYQVLLSTLKKGTEIKISLPSQELDENHYTFSLKGLSKLIIPHEVLCK